MRFDKCSAHNGHSELAQRLNPDTSRIREIFLIDNRQNIQLCGHREAQRGVRAGISGNYLHKQNLTEICNYL